MGATAENRKVNTDLRKAAGFISRLLSNKALDTLTPLQKEEQIAQFLSTNAQQLYPTLSSAQFFPGKNWNQISAILIQALIEETDKSFILQLEDFIRNRLDFTFVSFIQPHRIPAEKCKEEMLEFLKRILKKPEARRAFSGPFTAILFNLTDKYVDGSFNLKQYVHFELTKVQRLRMSQEEVKHMVKATLLLKAGVHLLTVGATDRTQELQSGVVHPHFVEKVFNILKGQLKILPQPLLKSALNSNLSFEENKKIEATARIASLFAARAKNFKQLARIDRGANSPDRSWFNIARKNYKFYGFDIKMLDEFYRIAAENGW